MSHEVLTLVIILIGAILFFRMLDTQRKSHKKDEVKTDTKKSVTITGNKILFDSNFNMIDPDETLKSLKILGESSNIYVINHVSSKSDYDMFKEKVEKQLESCVNPNHILFSQNPFGRASIARAVKSVVHFDYEPEGTKQASLFIKVCSISKEKHDRAEWHYTSFNNAVGDMHNSFAKQILSKSGNPI